MGQRNPVGQIDLQLFGTWNLEQGEKSIRPGLRQQRLIAALAILGPCPRNYLAGKLWPESTQAQAQSSLRVGIHLTLGHVPGLLCSDGCILSLSQTVDIDLHRVREVLEIADQGHWGGSVSALLGQLPTRDLLPGWYDDFVLEEQERLRHARLHRLRRIAHESLAGRDHEDASMAARAALSIEPYDDESIGYLIRAKMRRGDLAAAIRVYREYCETLRIDLGIAPSARLSALVSNAGNPGLHG